MRVFGVALLCLKIALVPLVLDPGSDVPFSVPKALLSHALAYVLAAVLLALLIRFGRSFATWSPVHIAVLAFFGASVAATVFAADPVVALYGTHVRMLGLGTIADGVVLYFAVALLVRSRAEAVASAVSVVASSVVVLAYEAVQLIGRDPFGWSASGALRPFSTLGQTTSLAEYLSVLFIGSVAIAAFAPGLSRPIRYWLLVYSVVVFAGLVATQTRSGLVGILTGGGLLLVLTWTAHPDRRTRVLSVGGAIVGSASLAFVLVFTPLGARVLGTVELSAAAEGDEDAGPHLEPSADVRLAFYRIAFEMVQARPLLGYGPDNFTVGVPKYRTATEPSEIQQTQETSAHGWLSHVAATSGLVGLAAFLTIVVTAFVANVRSGFRPAAWVGAGMLAAFLGAGATTVNEIGTEWLFWMSVGTIGAATARPWPVASANSDTRHRRRGSTGATEDVFLQSIGGYLALAVALLMALATINALDASRTAQASLKARLRGLNQDAITLGLRATSADPRRAPYWDELGLAYAGANRLNDAVSAFRHANELAPYDFRYSGDLARAYLELAQKGDSASGTRAREVAERSVQVDPNNPRAQLTRAVVMQVTGDLVEALRSVDRALVLDPQSTNDALYLTAVQVKVATGHVDDAIVVARTGLAVFGATRRTIPLRIELARALVVSGQTADAIHELDAVLSIDANNVPARQLRDQIQGSAGH